ncbi:hypothetical protein [Streptomyces sp. NPDC017991]|uniref:hypothetical protein n=1 Tax=Streptomyces sp. NPDC017991 TaxID=3365026 RepID=UPI00378D332C
MKKITFPTMVITAVLVAGSAAIAQPAAASTQDCGAYEYTRTSRVTAGQTSVPWQYLISLEKGPIEVCLDGPDDSDSSLTLLRLVPGGAETVATATDSGADKTLSYVGPVSGYVVHVSADVTGNYTVGVNLP